MISRLLQILHRHPITSTAILFVVGIALIFTTMVSLSQKTNEEMAEQYAENYIRSLNEFHSQYSSKIVARVTSHGIHTSSDYLNEEASIPFPATFSIELAEALTDPGTGIKTRLYSDFPFASRKDGGPRDEFESLALTKLRFAADKAAPYVRYEEVDGRYSLRYAKAILMQESCIDCHRSHPDSTKRDWKVGDVRGVRSVTLPLDAASQVAHRGWALTLAVMVALALAGLGLIFLVVQALRASIDMMARTNAAYNRFVPHEFLEYLNKKNIVDVELNDNVETEMTVLFSDIRSFTDLSEIMSPEENFKFVNRYLQVMGPIVRRNNGFIDKYIGDAIMALFDSSDDAMNASVEMLKALADFNVEHQKTHRMPLSIGVGLHKGRVRLGTIGESGRMDGTVISDAVNLASRIEGLTKFYGVQCLISENIYHSLSEPDRHSIRYVDKVKVKGKHVPVRIFEEFSADPLEIQNRKRLTLGTFEEATRLFAVKEFAKAKTLFEKVLEELPEDRASKSYIARCDRYANQELPDDWDGALDFDFK
jgi:class 3 adenylate cyclase